jgi:hypothetical protein
MSVEKNYFNAIVILKNGLACKYHNIHRGRIERFHKFIRAKFPGADHINYYPIGGGKCEKSLPI